jgi:hypothetical protein
MSNVLTPETKKKLSRSIRARYLTTLALVLVAGAFVAALALVPTFAALATARAALVVPAEEAEGARDDQAQAQRAQNLVKALSPLISSTTPSELLGDALSARPDGISVTSITYQARSKNIVLSGTSDGRQPVNAYRDALEAGGKFAGVSVPVSALAGTLDGRFTITLTAP